MLLKISRCVLKLVWRFWPTMMWSWTLMLTWASAPTTWRVMSMSACDGVGSPLGWLWTMMMARGRQLQGPLDHLARVERGVVDRAAALHLVADQDVLAVEEQDAEMLGRLVLHGQLQVVEQGRPGADHRPVLDLLLQHPLKQAVDGLQQHLGEAEVVVARLRAARAGARGSGPMHSA